MRAAGVDQESTIIPPRALALGRRRARQPAKQCATAIIDLRMPAKRCPGGRSDLRGRIEKLVAKRQGRNRPWRWRLPLLDCGAILRQCSAARNHDRKRECRRRQYALPWLPSLRESGEQCVGE